LLENKPSGQLAEEVISWRHSPSLGSKLTNLHPGVALHAAAHSVIPEVKYPRGKSSEVQLYHSPIISTEFPVLSAKT
jgi:hypothetical protein